LRRRLDPQNQAHDGFIVSPSIESMQRRANPGDDRGYSAFSLPPPRNSLLATVNVVNSDKPPTALVRSSALDGGVDAAARLTDRRRDCASASFLKADTAAVE
jgi:hypothetical protein